MQLATGRLLCALLLFPAIGHAASPRDAIAKSGAVTTRADGPSVPETTVCARKPMKSPPCLRIDIVFDGPPMPSKLKASAMEEVTTIWAAYGVDVSTPKASDCRSDVGVRLTVKLVDSADQRVSSGALGSIRFQDDVPEPAIVMYPDAIAALVSATPIETIDLHAPSVFADRILGRVLGRALAHEIGHFLLRSPHHSARGLMRALLPATELIDPDRRRFGLSAGEVTRLVSVTSTSLQPSPLARQTATPSRRSLPSPVANERHLGVAPYKGSVTR